MHGKAALYPSGRYYTELESKETQEAEPSLQCQVQAVTLANRIITHGDLPTSPEELWQAQLVEGKL